MMIASLLRWDNDYISRLESLLREEIVTCRSREEALRILPESDIIITVGGAPLLDRALLAACQRLRLVLSLSSGVDQLPLKELFEREIAVCNTKGAQAVSIAEHVIYGMLAVSHRYPSFIRNQLNQRWENIVGADLEGRTVCVIGAGQIGIEIGRKAKAFDMLVYGIKRHPGPIENFDYVWGNEKLHQALCLADFVVVATPLTRDTYHLLDTEAFKAMKKSAVVLNISRGQTIDEAAMIDALRSNEISWAVLDVFETEPLPPAHPLWFMDNVIITPHNAALTTNTEKKIIQILHSNIVNFREGRALINRLNQNDLY